MNYPEDYPKTTEAKAIFADFLDDNFNEHQELMIELGALIRKSNLIIQHFEEEVFKLKN